MQTGRLALPAIALILSACGGGDEEALPEVVRPVAMLTVGSAEGRGMMFPGTAQATDRADLAFRVAGQLLQFPVNEGDQVGRGALLARLDPADFNLELNEALAAYDKAEADYQRYKRLYEREAVSLAEVEVQRAQRDVTKARYDQAQLNVGYTYLRAPFQGTVGRKFVENFEDVQAKETVVSLQNLSGIEIVVSVPEQVLKLSETGTRDDFEAVATFAAAGEIEYPLGLKEIAAEADARTQTFRVTFMMPQPDEILILPGMTAQVWIRPRAGGATDAVEQTFLVPVTAVFADDAGISNVWVYDEGTQMVSARTVTIGEITPPDRIQVLAGLTAGETIATAGVNNLREGMQVRRLTR